ncbi:MAG: hypothetical protein KF799_03540 [Bdellovibrionales bacterium]|nr:hypothetical protein [Bdellovibrionales bacterium]
MPKTYVVILGAFAWSIAGCGMLSQGSQRQPASVVTCTASCVLDRSVVTVQGKGLDAQDALSMLKQKCDSAGREAKSGSHYLATSVAKPNAAHTSNQTEFDIGKACL